MEDKQISAPDPMTEEKNWLSEIFCPCNVPVLAILAVAIYAIFFRKK